MPDTSPTNGAQAASLGAVYAVAVTTRDEVMGLRAEVRRTGDACERVDGTLGELLIIEQEKLAHKKRMQQEQWAFFRDNWKVIAFVVAVLWMPEAVPSIVQAFVPGLQTQQQVVIMPASAGVGLAPPATVEAEPQ